MAKRSSSSHPTGSIQDIKKVKNPSMTASESKETELYSLHEMFGVISSQLTQQDFSALKSLFVGSLVNEDRGRIKRPSDLFFAMERARLCDSSNFYEILNVLRMITRHDLMPFVSRRKRRRAVSDQVDQYLDQCTSGSGFNSPSTSTPVPSSSAATEAGPTSKSTPSHPTRTLSKVKPRFCSSSSAPSSSSDSSTLPSSSSSSAPASSRRHRGMGAEEQGQPDGQHYHLETRNPSGPGQEAAERNCRESTSQATGMPPRSQRTVGISPEARGLPRERPKHTCDIRLRVRAEYCCHDGALIGQIHSNERDPLRRQLELFSQASAILKSRDLGSIVCDIKFSELTYLDAFWRDYINGSLLAALKDVFITDSLRAAVGDEAIKLLVNVDEDDYRAGRSKLLLNLVS
ncbi:death effector domain-containing protein-like [Diadema antillarum]|uniref:death effector domain-containing protein-like n=1 Tax=Diadema antillarum TaxID=105358 RepID=UPI003A835340